MNGGVQPIETTASSFYNPYFKVDVAIYSVLSISALISALGIAGVLPFNTSAAIASLSVSLVAICIYSVVKCGLATLNAIPLLTEETPSSSSAAAASTSKDATPTKSEKKPKPTLEEILQKGAVIQKEKIDLSVDATSVRIRVGEKAHYAMISYTEQERGSSYIKNIYVDQKSVGSRGSISLTENPVCYKFFNDKLAVCYSLSVNVHDVPPQAFLRLKQNEDYSKEYFNFSSHLVDINDDYLAFATRDAINLFALKSPPTRFLINNPTHMGLSGNHLMAANNGTLKVWDLTNKTKVFELTDTAVRQVFPFKNGFLYSTWDEIFSQRIYFWEPGQEPKLFISGKQLIFSPSENFVALVKDNHIIEIYNQNWERIRVVHLKEDICITDIQLAGAFILYKSKSATSHNHGTISYSQETYSAITIVS